MTDEPFHYTTDLETLKRERLLKELVPQHVEDIRANLERLELASVENSDRLDRLLELIERQNDILSSIDHAHYYLKPYSEVLLARILLVLLACAIGGLIYVVI